MATIAQVTDGWGRAVELTDRGWGHILDRHGELALDQAQILATVAFPDFVMRDAAHSKRRNSYRVVADRDSPQPLYLKVCVEYDEARATIITGYLTRVVRPREEPLWP